MTLTIGTCRSALPLILMPALAAPGQVDVPASDADTTMSSLSTSSTYAESITIVDDCNGDG